MTNLLLLNLNIYGILIISLILSLLIAFILLFLSFLIAIQMPDSEKVTSYECGFEPFEDARNRFDVRFYIIAILFLIFDLEVAYLFPWSSTLSISGYLSYRIRLVFLFLLTIGFIYEVDKGALNS